MTDLRAVSQAHKPAQPVDQHTFRLPPAPRSAAGQIAPRTPFDALPPELWTRILHNAADTPLENVRLQRVSRRFCASLRGDEFWRHVCPDAPSYSTAASAARPHNQMLYWQFQNRTRGYTPLQQHLLRDYWGAKTPFVLPAIQLMSYDIARAAVPYARFAGPYRPFKDDASMMLALATRGPELLHELSPRLRADFSFMTRAIDAKVTNYRLTADALRQNASFNAAILRKHGHALSLMPDWVRANRKDVLVALQHWQCDVARSCRLLGPYESVDKQLRRDPQVVYACTRICPSSFVLAVAQAPECHWDKDRTLVTLALRAPPPVERALNDPTAVALFSRVHTQLRDDEDIALRAVVLSGSNYSLVSYRLQTDFVWLGKAVRANRNVFFNLAQYMRRHKPLVASMLATDQFACLGALKATVGADKDMLLNMLRDPQVRQGRYFNRLPKNRHTIFANLSTLLRVQPDVLRAVLDFDGREIGPFGPGWQQNTQMYDYAVRALLTQLREQQRARLLRQKAAAKNTQKPMQGQAPLGLFARDVHFARQFLLILPEHEDDFCDTVRWRTDIRQLSGLGLLLQKEAGISHAAMGSERFIKKLKADLRGVPDDFALNLVLGAFYMLLGDWRNAQLWLSKAMGPEAQKRATLPQRQICQCLLSRPAKALPQRGEFWYRGVFSLARNCHQNLLQQANLAGQTLLLWD